MVEEEEEEEEGEREEEESSIGRLGLLKGGLEIGRRFGGLWAF